MRLWRVLLSLDWGNDLLWNEKCPNYFIWRLLMRWVCWWLSIWFVIRLRILIRLAGAFMKVHRDIYRQGDARDLTKEIEDDQTILQVWRRAMQVCLTGTDDGCNGGSNHRKRLWPEKQDALQELNSLIGLKVKHEIKKMHQHGEFNKNESLLKKQTLSRCLYGKLVQETTVARLHGTSAFDAGVLSGGNSAS